LPVVGLLIAFVVATALEHRVFQRVMAALCAIGAFGLVAAMGLFMLDAIQVRSLMRPEALSSWGVATLTAVVKFVIAIVAIGWFALAGFRNTKPSKRATSPGLVVGGSNKGKPAVAGASAEP
jgi:uncharacterized membrane protein